MTDEKKADIVLSGGQEITIDLRKIKVAEWRAILNGKLPNEEEDELMEGICGLEPGSIAAMELPDWKALNRAFFRKAAAPLEDPN